MLVIDAGALSWTTPTGLFTWKQHERVLSVLMQLFCPYHDKVLCRCIVTLSLASIDPQPDVLLTCLQSLKFVEDILSLVFQLNI